MRNRCQVFFASLVAFAAAWAPAQAGFNLYDMDGLLSEPHPFARPSAAAPAAPPAAAPPTVPPVAPSPAAQRPRAAAPPPPPGPAEGVAGWKGNGLKGGFSTTFNFIGTHSIIDGHQLTGGTNLQVRHDVDQVAGNSLAFGYSWWDSGIPLRAEIEAGVRYRFDLDYRATVGGTNYGYEVNLATASAMFNAYYDFHLWPDWTPHLGAGIGWARHWAETERSNLATGAVMGKDFYTDNLSWAAMAGITYNWSPQWGVVLDGRYIDLGDVEVGSFGGEKITLEYYSFDLILGLTYVF